MLDTENLRRRTTGYICIDRPIKVSTVTVQAFRIFLHVVGEQLLLSLSSAFERNVAAAFACDLEETETYGKGNPIGIDSRLQKPLIFHLIHHPIYSQKNSRSWSLLLFPGKFQQNTIMIIQLWFKKSGTL
jgi:hypothetical protein